MRWPFENSQYKGENCSIGEDNNKLAAKKKKHVKYLAQISEISFGKSKTFGNF